MGMYVNTGNKRFQGALDSEIYVDKTGLISFLNNCIGTEKRYIAVCRARRFGKSMAANMIQAYYCHTCDSSEMFAPYEIAQPDKEGENKCYLKHLNKYNVLMLDIGSFVSNASLIGKDPIQYMSEVVTREFCEEFLALAYITGIMPIKKLGGESVVNEFKEYTMISPKNLAPFFGFSEDEVRNLCEDYGADMEKMKNWYDGYTMNGKSIYNPNSVVNSLMDGCYESYWTNTSSFETINKFIEMDYNGLKDDAVSLLSGNKERIKVNVRNFKNDLHDIESRDDCLTALIHLGYLAYDAEKKEAFIPNYEIHKYGFAFRGKEILIKS